MEQTLVHLTGALSEVARAVDKLSVQTVAGRWEELEAAVRAIGATLDSVMEAIQAQPLRPAGPLTP